MKDGKPMPERRPALGRGLNALIPEGAPLQGSAASDRLQREVDLDLLTPNAEQPRRDMDAQRLDDLARSIASSGVIQPILVRPLPQGRYEIVAGERRWRAAQRAGLLKVPVVVRDVPADKRLELALVENIQRENLNPMEEARAYQRLADEFGLTQDAIAAAVGKERATVANYMRLLGLAPEVQQEVAAGALSMGHARALAALSDASRQRDAARQVRRRDLSVRETEALVRKITVPPSAPRPAATDVHTRAAEEQLRKTLGTRVRIVRRRRGGTVEIRFGSEEELQRLYVQLTTP